MKVFIFSFIFTLGIAGADDFIEYKLRNDEHLRYRVFTPKAEIDSYRLVVFLPGGDGSEAFTPWLKSIYQHAMPSDFIAVQLIAPKWTDEQDVIWPTRKTPVRKMGEPVEDFFETVVRKVKAQFSIGRNEIYTFSWSSGGVPAYLIAAEKRGNVRGSFVDDGRLQGRMAS